MEDEALSFLLEEEKREKERLKTAIGCAKNAGKTFDEVCIYMYTCACIYKGLPLCVIQVGVRQKQRKLSQIKTYASSTLEPCMESYGLTPTTLTAHSSSGVPVTIPLNNSLTIPSSSTENPSTSSNVSEAACTLYLLDHFGVSDQFYHELAQVQTDPIYT